MHPASSISLLLMASAACLPVSAQEIDVKVDRRGDVVLVDVTARVAAPLAVAWAVLTDYENMHHFGHGLKTSQVLRRDGNQLEVAQSGATNWGPFTITFELVRAVELVPHSEIHSKLIRGSFKTFESTTRLQAGAGITQVSHHGEYVPSRWLPPMVGPSVIADETRKQYQALMAEVLRRAAAQKEAPARP